MRWRSCQARSASTGVVRPFASPLTVGTVRVGRPVGRSVADGEGRAAAPPFSFPARKANTGFPAGQVESEGLWKSPEGVRRALLTSGIQQPQTVNRSIQ